MMQVGCGADWSFEFAVNGETAYSTLKTGNHYKEFAKTNHIFNFPVKKGKNLVAVQVRSGSGGWSFFCGAVPFRENLSGITETVRGKEWRPINMDNVKWEKLVVKRIDSFKRIPGSALDLSQYVPRYDVDKCGRLKADRNGRLYFENMPGKPVRLRGFNAAFFANWESNFYRMSKKEIEELAEEIRLAGMNVIRFHTFYRAFYGDQGLRGEKERPLSALPQTVAEISGNPLFDKDFADRYYYFIKCMRDRGIYIMMDIGNLHIFFPGKPKGLSRRYADYALLAGKPEWRNHWKASFDFLLKTKNPYTGKSLIEDNQLVAITFLNEQEHLFTIEWGKDKAIKLLTPDWQKHRNPANPSSAGEFNGKLVFSDTPEGEAARKFIRAKVEDTNNFYTKYVRESGYKGFITNWDMFVRNLEGDARKDLDAVAMHTYHCHPLRREVKPGERWEPGFFFWERRMRPTVGINSSIELNNYVASAAVTRILGKPMFMTEISHAAYNRYSHEAGPVQAAAASLQDWQMLTPHSDLIRLYHQPGWVGTFDGASSIPSIVSSLFTAFGWQRGDISSAKHAVSYQIPEKLMATPAYAGALGSCYNTMSLLTRVGTEYRSMKNPAATHHFTPEVFSKAVSMGMFVRLQEDPAKTFFKLREQVEFLRKNGILTPDNKTNVNAGIYQSETKELLYDVKKHTLAIDTPKLQSVVIKEDVPVKTSALSVKSASVPCTIAAISLENDKPLSAANRMLMIIATRFSAEGAVFTDENFSAQLKVGDYQQLMQSGKFKFSIKTGMKSAPEVYALNLNGSREFKVPFKFNNGTLEFNLDTSTFKYGTPYFEIVK